MHSRPSRLSVPGGHHFALLLFAASLVHAQSIDPCRAGAEAASQRDFTNAEKLLKQCMAAEPAQIQPYLTLAAIYQLQKNSEALYRTALDAIKNIPQEKRFYLTAATHDGRAKRYESAIKILSEASLRWPEDPQIRSLLASSHFGRGTELLDAGRNESAADHLRRATQLAPADIEANLNLGRALHNMLRNSEALAAFNRVLELNPAMPLARFHRGFTWYMLGEFEHAVDDLDKDIAANSNYAPAYLIRGLARSSNGEWEKAIVDLEIAARKMPDNAQAHHAKGRALVQLNRFEQAEASLRKAMELDPADPAPVNALVTVLFRLDRVGEARPLAQRAADLALKKRTANPGQIRFEGVRK
jgi:tetratricopeptide (TPR) repeat protein